MLSTSFSVARRAAIVAMAVGAASLSTAVVGATAASAAKRASVTFTVNSIADRPDAKVNGVCLTSVSGECTLRAAIQEANAAAGPATIAFAIPGTGLHTIKPTSAYPILTNANGGITIDGFTQPGSTANTSALADNAVYRIELAGPGPTKFDAFVLHSPGSMIRGLDIHGFNHAIYMDQTSSASNTIVGNMIGLTPTGNYDPNDKLVNSSSCIIMQGGAHDNVIGRPNLADRNVISGCSHEGIATYNYPTTRNTVQNNIIGLDPTGTQKRMNQSHGMDINTGTTYTMVGGTAPLERNVIAGNFQTGVEISHIPSTAFNSVINNYIGTNLDASAAPAYARNGQFGVNLEGRGTCNGQVCPSDAHNNTVEGNVIVNSGVGGVMIDKGQNHDTVANNYIGVLPNGTAAGNADFGVRFEAGAYSNTVSKNVIAYNGAGVQLEATGTQPPNSTESPTNFNQITKNSIFGNTAGLGIDFKPYGALNTTVDPNLNEGVLAPILSKPTKTSVTVTTCASCTIELFISSKGNGQFGQGQTFLTSGVANAKGTLVLTVPAAGAGKVVTADATTPKLSTSENSRGLTIP
ncbi:MAG TPA: NosD domain-containing protein [Acidimicrobiia bacterium]|jgi:CSLREA domain-containing protein